MPFVPGFDGVGTLPDGRRVYFFGPPAPSEPWRSGVWLWPAVPSAARLCGRWDGGRAGQSRAGVVGSVAGPRAAAGGRVGACKRRDRCRGAAGGPGGEATGRAQGDRDWARSGGAGEAARVGADETIWLQQSDEALVGSFRRALAGVDVVLDICGDTLRSAFLRGKGRGNPQGERRVRYVQIGSISGDAISLRADLLRSSGVELMAAGWAASPLRRL